MNKSPFRIFIISISVVCGVWVPASAQTDRIDLRVAPRPNQTVRMRMIQETDVDISFDPTSAPVAATAPMKLVTKTTIAITQAAGPAKRDGNIDAELTYDELNSQVTMNGQIMPANNAGGSFIGKTVTITFDKQGGVVNIKVPADVGVPEESFRQMLESMYGNLPAVSLGLGETTKVPLDFTLPLPIPGAAPMKMSGDVKHTLISIRQDPAGRVAKLDHTIDGQLVNDMELPSAAGKVKMSLDFKISGGGGTLRDLDKGFVRSSETNATFDGTMKISGEQAARQLPSMTMHGTTKTIVTGTN